MQWVISARRGLFLRIRNHLIRHKDKSEKEDTKKKRLSLQMTYTDSVVKTISFLVTEVGRQSMKFSLYSENLAFPLLRSSSAV